MKPPPPAEVSFKPLDNRRLANLGVALDENLRQIETALDVVIVRRGGSFTLAGAPERTRQAEQALRNFYARAGDDLTVEDVQLGLIEVARGAAPATGKDGPTSALKTRRHDLHGRTPRQVEYLEQIQKHDITFAIGPATRFADVTVPWGIVLVLAAYLSMVRAGAWSTRTRIGAGADQNLVAFASNFDYARLLWPIDMACSADMPESV